MAPDPPVPVLHVITRLIVGGAQENTVLTADWLGHHPDYRGRYAIDVISGPQAGPEGSLMEEARQRGVRVTVSPELVRELNPAHDLRALLGLRRLMVDAAGLPRYQIVHTHSSKAGILGRAAARWARIPIIVHTVHGWSFHEYMAPARRGLYVTLEKLAGGLSRALIVTSTVDMEKGLAHGIGRREQYEVIRSGIELERFSQPQAASAGMRRRLGLPSDALVVGSVTRLVPQKAPIDLVETFALVHRNRPDTRFVIVGDGPLRAATEQRLQALGIATRTTLTGLRRDVPELLATFDVFVSTGLWEGLPRVLPQAMAGGIPVVCTRADGTPEAVADGENGFLVEAGQPVALAARVLTLLGDARFRERMGAAGRVRAAEFGVAQMVRQMDLLYQRLLAQDRVPTWSSRTRHPGGGEA